MRPLYLAGALALAALPICGPVGAQEPDVVRDRARLMSAAPEPEGPGTPLGPYANVMVTEAPGLTTHTVYYPDPSALPEGETLPVLIWGNGACVNNGRMFEQTLTKIASHGFLVVAVGHYEPEQGAPRTTGPQMIEAIDWIEASPALPSPVSKRIDSGKIAAMGQSCGGLMTVEAAGDKRLDTIGVINSGVFAADQGAGLSNITVSKDDLGAIHTPALYLNGGPSDIAFENSNDDFERIEGVPVFYGIMEGAGHFATHRHKNGGRFAEIMSAWLEWHLKDDAEARAVFVGETCGLCEDPQWEVLRKNF